VVVAGETALYDQPVLTLDPGMHTAMIRRVDVSATGAYAVSGSDDKTVRLWEAPTGQLLRTIRLPQGPGHVGKVGAVAMTPDGALVAAGGYTGRGNQYIYLFHRSTGDLVRRLDGLPTAVAHLTFSSTGRYLAATLDRRNGLRVYDRDADWREVARDAPYDDESYGAAFAADGRLATTSMDGTLRLYDHAFRRVAVAKTTDGMQPWGIAFTPAGDRLAVGYDDTTAVSLFDGNVLTPLPGPNTRGIDNGNLVETTGARAQTVWWCGPKPVRAPGASWLQAPSLSAASVRCQTAGSCSGRWLPCSRWWMRPVSRAG
jgi:WD40 repeat protein